MSIKFFEGKNIHGLCEATRCEEMYLWLDNKDYMSWPARSLSVIVTVGTLDNRPIVLSLTEQYINGKLVVFYHPTSQLVDWKMIDEFLDKEFPNIKRTDADNFHILSL